MQTRIGYTRTTVMMVSGYCTPNMFLNRSITATTAPGLATRRKNQ